MPENVNTTPLDLANASGAQAAPADDRAVMVDVSHVSMIFNMANQQLNSLKEYAIALARRELMFKEFRALDDVSFTVRKGDVFGILGTNGSGKSTMLKIITGVLEPSEGTCSINGNIAPLIELGAGFDFELTARENIYLNGALLGYSHKFIDQHFDEIVEFAEVEKFLDMPMKNYSSGMVARIAFAIATVIVPEILIVDEVLSVGDFMFQQKCERRITSLIKEHDVTVLIVSHNNDQIERLCNKAIWIEKGHTRMIGSAEDVCRTYRVLGGHVGSPEAEQQVFEMLNAKTTETTYPVDAISAESHYGTATMIAEKCLFETSGTAILAPGEYPAQCMALCGLSGMLDAPILLSKSDCLPDITAQELRRLQPESVYVFGNETLITEDVLKSVREALGDEAAIARVECETSAETALAAFGLGTTIGANWSRTAMITYNECMGDLVSFSPHTFAKHIPTFFVKQHGVVDDRTSKILQSGIFDELFVLGDDVHVPDTFLNSCEAAGVRCERVCGKGPYHANEIINNRISGTPYKDGCITSRHLIVTSAWTPFDALATAAYAAKTGSIFLLEDTQDLDSVAHALAYIQEQDGAVKHLTFLGDETRFNKLDKQILGKAVVLAQETHKK